jgi:hypothetical protein
MPAKKTAKAKTAKKDAPGKRLGAMTKVSPLRGMPVADWIAKKASGWQAEAIARVLKLAKRVAPAATWSIKWGQPVLEENGPLAWIKPAKAHVTFGFWRGAMLRDHDGVLEGGARMKHVKLTSEAIDEERLADFLKQAVRLNRENGDPTRR